MMRGIFYVAIATTSAWALSPPTQPFCRELLCSDSSSFPPTLCAKDAIVDESLRDLPPVIQHIADERQEFQVNLGKAMDTLRKDMPEILKCPPDYSIYHEDIRVIDPSGVQLTGIESYKQSIHFMHAILKFWFQGRSGLQFRMVYDFCRSSIRVSWHIVLVPKVPLGRPFHLDGISNYKLDPTSGLIVEHQIDNLMINDSPVMPPYGIFSLLQQDLVGFSSGKPGVSIPAGI
eukprot:scaffold25694_cov127-Cylindrotheca_fusiformis.AAC.3